MKSDIEISKFLSLILRHKPETIGLNIDEHGWALINDIIIKSKEKQIDISYDKILKVVKLSDKKRFVISSDLKKIKANQGHSIDVVHDFKKEIPPDILYHGTATKNLDSILEKGIVKGQRHHVHLSDNKDTAINVGKRYGEPVVIKIDSSSMNKDGISFFISENKVWLVDYVHPKYILK